MNSHKLKFIQLELPLVKEKNNWILFLHPVYLIFFLISIIVSIFIIAKIFHIITEIEKFAIVTAVIFAILLILSRVRFFFKLDYEIIGKIIFNDNEIQIKSNKSNLYFDTKESCLKLMFDGVRNRGIQEYGRDFERRGISSLSINNKEVFYFILSNEDQRNNLKRILSHYYEDKVVLDEFMRFEGQHRLVKLQFDFNWNEFKEIEANNLLRKNLISKPE